MAKQRYIVIPLWDHTTDEEIVDCLDALDCHGFDDVFVIKTDEDIVKQEIEVGK